MTEAEQLAGYLQPRTDPLENNAKIPSRSALPSKRLKFWRSRSGPGKLVIDHTEEISLSRVGMNSNPEIVLFRSQSALGLWET
jgi:hypothetical protein